MFSPCLTKVWWYGIMYLVTNAVGSGLVPEGTELVPKPMLTYLYAIL